MAIEHSWQLVSDKGAREQHRVTVAGHIGASSSANKGYDKSNKSTKNKKAPGGRPPDHIRCKARSDKLAAEKVLSDSLGCNVKWRQDISDSLAALRHGEKARRGLQESVIREET
jgi:thiamine monophosphate kinase